MASSASTVLRQEVMTPGEQDGTWGTKNNTNLGILESAVTGTTAVSTTGGTTVLTNVDYTNDQAKKAVLDVTGTLVSNAIIEIPNASKTYKVFNRTTGSYTLSVKTNSGTAIAITQGTSCEVYCDGSNVVRFLTPMTTFGTGAPATASGAAASAVSVTPTGNLGSTNAQAALAELQGDVDTINSTLIASYQPLDSDLTTLAGLAKTDGGFIVGNGTIWTVETADTARTSLGVGTGDSPTFTGLTTTTGTITTLTTTSLELGATDTTLARASAGDVSVEGNRIFRVGGVDVPVADGGTGASTAADARTNLGLGTMAVQAASAVAITGGTIAGTVTKNRSAAIPTTSGTAAGLTGIPSWATEITVIINGVDISAAGDEFLVQLGTSGGYVATGYVSGCSFQSGTTTSTAGMIITGDRGVSDETYGFVTIRKASNNAWLYTSVTTHVGQNPRQIGAGRISNLGGTLDRVQLVGVSGGTFTAGEIIIEYA